MRFEIERRFLVKADGWRRAAVSSVRLTDGLISQTREGKVRVRTCGSAAWLTVKGPRRGLTRSEQDLEISADGAQRLIRQACCGRVIEKTRYSVMADRADAVERDRRERAAAIVPRPTARRPRRFGHA